MRNSNPSGYTLPELMVVVVVIGVVASLAVPSMRTAIDLIRVRSGLNQVTSQLYLARALAVADGGTVRLLFHSTGECISSTQLVSDNREGTTPLPSFELDLPGICLRHSGDSIMIFNSRGILRPPTRSIFATGRYAADSVLVSIAGRVRRSY